MQRRFWRWLTADDLGTLTLSPRQIQQAEDFTRSCELSMVVRHALVEDPAVRFWAEVDARLAVRTQDRRPALRRIAGINILA